jgi:hypothetical protein
MDRSSLMIGSGGMVAEFRGPGNHIGGAFLDGLIASFIPAG